MNPVSLLLSPQGRMKRLNYVLLSGLVGMMNFGLLVLAGLQSQAGLMEILQSGPLFLFQASPLLAGVCALGLWIQCCFVFKRSRDFSGSVLTGWVFVACWAAPYVAPQTFGLVQGEPFGMAKLAVAVPGFIAGLVLFFADSKEEGSVQTVAYESGSDAPETSGLAALADSTDLVARAKALNNMDASGQADPQPLPPSATRPQSSVATAPVGFGRRKSFVRPT